MFIITTNGKKHIFFFDPSENGITQFLKCASFV